MPTNAPQNTPLYDSADRDMLTLFRRNSLEPVSNSFQLQQRDQYGGQVYSRSNLTLQNLATPVGYKAIASGNRSAAVGAYAYAREDSSTAIGIYANALGANSVAIGDQARAGGYRAIAIGAGAVAAGANSISIGNAGNAAGANSLAVGSGAKASGSNSVAVGCQNVVTANDATSVGQGSVISGARTSSVGRGNTSTFADCVMVGNSITTTAAGQVILGSGTTTFSDIWLGRGPTHTGAATTTNVHATNGVGTDVAGDHLAIIPGLCTGNAAGGNVNIYRSDFQVSSGSTILPAVLAFQLQPTGDAYYTGTGALPTFAAAFADVGLLRLGPARSAANSGMLLNTKTDGNGNIGEVAVITTGATMFAIASLKQGTAVNIPIVFFAEATGAGTTANGQMAVANGVWVGDESAQTYNNQGTLTVAAGVYLGASAYTNPDYVFEHHFHGGIERFADHDGADLYKGLRPLEVVEAYAEEHLHLPQLADLGLRKTSDIFSRADGALLIAEEIFLHLFDMNRRLKALETP